MSIWVMVVNDSLDIIYVKLRKSLEKRYINPNYYYKYGN